MANKPPAERWPCAAPTFVCTGTWDRSEVGPAIRPQAPQVLLVLDQLPHADKKGRAGARQRPFLPRPHSLHKTFSDDMVSVIRSKYQAALVKIGKKFAIRRKGGSFVFFQSVVFY